jgi:hypothetical protein
VRFLASTPVGGARRLVDSKARPHRRGVEMNALTYELALIRQAEAQLRAQQARLAKAAKAVR